MSLLALELIPFSGIQIIDFEIDLTKINRPSKFFSHSNNDELFPISADETGDDQFPNVFSEPYNRVIEEFQEKWLPAPVFRFAGTDKEGSTFDEGPSTWARMRAKIKTRGEDQNVEKVICQLALDTAVDLEEYWRLSGDDFYLMPSKADVMFEKEYGFVHSSNKMAWFLDTQINDDGNWRDAQEWVTQWILGALKDNGLSSSRANKWRAWAKYFTLVEVFGKCEIPRLKLIDTISQNSRYKPISTDFVVDLGNSRTCGILIEKPENDAVKIESAIPFKVRDFENAEVYSSGLLESRIELSQANFGRDDLAKQSGRMGAFLWPSPVRIGAEANSIQSKTKGTEAPSGLSSAKRYLWDLEPAEREWRFANAPRNSFPAIAMRTREILTDHGELKKTKDENLSEIKFSRSSFTMFMIAELISHAFAQINNPQERSDRPNSNLPRKLSKIILTIPTATPAFEQNILRKRANDALEYVWKILELPLGHGVYEKPELLIQWDEASCSQQVFLYNEIREKYADKAKEYFIDFGIKRKIRNIESDSLRIASVDIGGGTTDLMVICYSCEAQDVIYPVQEFREGFRIAGDDILFSLIREAILPSLAKHLTDEGGSNVDAAMANFFKSIIDAQAPLKSTFANSVLVPAAVKILKSFENSENKLATIVVKNPLAVNEGAFTSTLNGLAKSMKLNSWPSKDIKVNVPLSLFEKCIDNVMTKVTDNIAVALNNFDCDYVLLTGRPSKLPYIREMFENRYIVKPHRLISLHEYNVGSWYPFRDPYSGKIGDPKSTVVVGALLNSVCSFELTNYSFKSENLILESTANFVGEMETTGQILNNKVIIDNIRNQRGEDFKFTFHNAIHIGCRQMADENWTTAPLYRLSLHGTRIRQFTLPFEITLTRDIGNFNQNTTADGPNQSYLRELIEIGEISDSEGRIVPKDTLKLSYNTLGKVDHYWLESGLFM